MLMQTVIGIEEHSLIKNFEKEKGINLVKFIREKLI